MLSVHRSIFLLVLRIEAQFVHSCLISRLSFLRNILIKASSDQSDILQRFQSKSYSCFVAFLCNGNLIHYKYLSC